MQNYDALLSVLAAFVIALTISMLLFGCEIVHENCVWEQGVNACLMEVRRTPLDKPTKIWIVKNRPGYSVYPLTPDDSNFMGDAQAAVGVVPIPTLPLP